MSQFKMPARAGDRNCIVVLQKTKERQKNVTNLLGAFGHCPRNARFRLGYDTVSNVELMACDLSRVKLSRSGSAAFNELF